MVTNWCVYHILKREMKIKCGVWHSRFDETWTAYDAPNRIVCTCFSSRGNHFRTYFYYTFFVSGAGSAEARESRGKGVCFVHGQDVVGSEHPRALLIYMVYTRISSTYNTIHICICICIRAHTSLRVAAYDRSSWFPKIHLESSVVTSVPRYYSYYYTTIVLLQPRYSIYS